MIPKIKKICDLSQAVFHACPAWPSYKPANLNYEARFAIEGFTAERIDMNTHTGTHVDAPFHFTPEGETVDIVDLAKFTGRGIVMDLRNIDSASIDKIHLEPFEDRLKPDDIVILYTAWGQKRDMTKEYLFEWPYLSEEGAIWLKDHSVKTVCTDGMSVGGWPEGTGEPPHRVLLSNGIVIVEELYIDDTILSEDEWFISAFPIKMQGCSGAPARMVAIAFE